MLTQISGPPALASLGAGSSDVYTMVSDSFLLLLKKLNIPVKDKWLHLFSLAR